MKAKLQEDIKTAMKEKAQLRLNTLRGVLSEVKNYEIDKRQDVTPEIFISIVQKEVKKRRDAIESAEKAARSDIIEQNQAEIKILQTYLGDQLSEEQLGELIKGLIANGVSNLGGIMGALNKDYKGRFEGKAASELAKRALG